MSVEKQNILRVIRLCTWLEEQITLITARLFWMNLSTKNMCSMFGRFPVFTLLSSLYKLSLSSRRLVYLIIYFKIGFQSNQDRSRLYFRTGLLEAKNCGLLSQQKISHKLDCEKARSDIIFHNYLWIRLNSLPYWGLVIWLQCEVDFPSSLKKLERIEHI